MTADTAAELKPYGIAVMLLYPALVRTEKVMEAARYLHLRNSEPPEFMTRRSLTCPKQGSCTPNTRD